MYNLSTASSRRRCFVCALDFDGRRRRRFHERVEVHVVDIHLVDGFLRVGGIRRRRFEQSCQKYILVSARLLNV